MNYKPSKILSWDCKEQPDIENLNFILTPYGLCVRWIDDGSDNYNLVFGQTGMSQEEAERVFKDEKEKWEASL